MHVIVVACDAIHLGYLGCYGNDWVATPTIDRLAYEGFLFDRCYTNWPEHGGCLAEAPAADLRAAGWTTAFFTDHADPVPADASTAFEAIKRFVDAPLPEQRQATFAELAEHPDYIVPDEPTEEEEEWIQRWRQQIGFDREFGDGASRSIERLFASAAHWIAERRDRPTFSWLDIALESALWLPPTEERRKYLDEGTAAILDPVPGFVGDLIDAEDLDAMRATYAGRISYFDTLLGEFLAKLALPPEDRFIIFTSDRGTPLGEHEIIGPYRPWMHDELVHVPLILQLPGGRACARSPSLAQTFDLKPTLREACNLAPIETGAGRSLLPFLRGEALPARDYVCIAAEDEEYAIQTNLWKLILPAGRPLPDEPRSRQLYVKPEDRWEKNEVAEQFPDVADLLELQLRRYLDAFRTGAFDLLPPIRQNLVAEV